MDKIRPDYYKSNGHDLIWQFEMGLLTRDELIGFFKGNVFKYVTRFEQKNGLEDLEKAEFYLKSLKEFVYKKEINND